MSNHIQIDKIFTIKTITAFAAVFTIKVILTNHKSKST